MPPLARLTSPGHKLVESSADELPDNQSMVTVERVYETPRREAPKQQQIPLNANGHPMVAVK